MTFAQTLDKQLTRIWKELQNAFFSLTSAYTEGGTVKFRPDADVIEEESYIKILIDLPGMSKNDITLALVDGELRVQGTRSNLYEDTTVFRQQERMEGDFQRYFSMPSEADAKSIKAKFINGVLQVTISKAGKQEPDTSIPIE